MSESPSHHSVEESTLVSRTSKLSLLKVKRHNELRRKPDHAGNHKYYQRSYLLSHTFYSKIPKYYWRPLLPKRFPPLYCLGIPFSNADELFICACNLPFEEIGPVPREVMAPPRFLKDPAGAVSAINEFFTLVLGKEVSFHFNLEWCYYPGVKEDEGYRALPVACFQDNHFTGSLQAAENKREKIQNVMERYLFPEELWTPRKSSWFLGWRAVFDENDAPRPENMCPICA